MEGAEEKCFQSRRESQVSGQSGRRVPRDCGFQEPRSALFGKERESSAAEEASVLKIENFPWDLWPGGIL